MRRASARPSSTLPSVCLISIRDKTNLLPMLHWFRRESASGRSALLEAAGSGGILCRRLDLPRLELCRVQPRRKASSIQTTLSLRRHVFEPGELVECNPGPQADRSVRARHSSAPLFTQNEICEAKKVQVRNYIFLQRMKASPISWWYCIINDWVSLDFIVLIHSCFFNKLRIF